MISCDDVKIALLRTFHLSCHTFKAFRMLSKAVHMFISFVEKVKVMFKQRKLVGLEKKDHVWCQINVLMLPKLTQVNFQTLTFGFTCDRKLLSSGLKSCVCLDFLAL